MKRIIIFGNSGSGKSTLAKDYVNNYKLAHLDLDDLAWLDTTPPKRKHLKECSNSIDDFIETNQEWVIEGCYSDLLGWVINRANETIFLNPGVDVCINNCQSRPWEPHKYKTKDEQDKNLQMLLRWVADYPNRDDEFSLNAHKALFEKFKGNKVEYCSNDREMVTNKSD